MRKLISLSLGVALTATVFVAIPASADPAMVVHDQGPCGMVGAGPDGGIIYGGPGFATHVVQNDNHVMVTCKGTDIRNESGRTQHFSGFGCGALLPGGEYLTSNDSHATVTKKGKATLTCKVTFGAE